MSVLRGRRWTPRLVPLFLLSLGAAPLSGAPAKPFPTPAPPRKVVLVEAQGSTAQVDPFISRFLSEVSDRSDIAIVDARLSGAHFAELKVSPPTEDAKAFKAAWPADLYLGIALSDCATKSLQARVPGFNDPTTGARTVEVIRTLRTECPATAALIDAKDGRSVATATVTGSREENPESVDTSFDPTQAAEQEAAEKAAKKLFGTRKK
jgi:hypothetical protein